jgi:hypothetical protein
MECLIDAAHTRKFEADPPHQDEIAEIFHPTVHPPTEKDIRSCITSRLRRSSSYATQPQSR